MNRTIWTVRNGQVLEIRTGTRIVRIDPVLDLEQLQHAGCTLQDIDGYLSVYSSLNTKQIPTEVAQIREAFEGPVRVRPAQETKEKVLEKVQAYEHLRMGQRGETPSDSFRMPEKLKNSTPYRFIPKVMTDMMYGVMEQNETTSPKAIYKSPEWTWTKSQTMMIPGILRNWTELGVIKRLGRGQYQIGWPSEALREFAKKKGVEITPEDIRANFWVPERIARSYLERLAQEGLLKKHVRHDEWNMAHVPEIATKSPINGDEQEKKHVATASMVVARPKYDASEFKFKKGDIVCSECGHHFGHAYYRGNYKLCMNCYRTVVGGSTAHGKGATIQKE